MEHQMFNDPFTSSMSSLEADIFSGGHHHLAPSPQWPGLDHDIPAAPAANNAISSGGSGSHRKMNHSAYERDSRKQLNEHYSNLRSLLPDDDHHTRKLGNPTIVSRVIKYIPELQKEVDGLEKKKEQLTRAASCRPGDDTAPIVSATCLDDREVMVQVSLLNTMAGALPMSKCIKVLENQGLCLISSSASTFQNRTFYSLHLQRTQRTMCKESSSFCDELENAVKQKAELHPHY